MEQTRYGERYLDRRSPPSNATGLIIRQWLEKNTHTKGVFFGNKVDRYYIFRWISGSYDYCNKYQGDMCGGFTAAMGYWHYDTEAERDKVYEQLMEKHDLDTAP